MDSLYLLLKFVHVAAVIVWVGGIFALSVLNAGAARGNDPAAQAAIGRQSEFFGRVAVGPAMVITLLAGIATAASVGFPFSSPWIVWGLIGIVVSGALIAVIGRTAGRVGELARSGDGSAAQLEAVRGRLLALNALNLLLLASVVWAMVFKPTF